MKGKSRFIILMTVSLIIIFAGCSLISGFLRSPNKIMDWVTIPDEDTEFIFSVVDYLNGTEVDDGEYTMIVTNVEDSENDAIITLEDETETEYYIIIDKNDGLIVMSYDDVLDNDDIIILSTPVEIGNDWEEYDGADHEMEITHIDADKSVDEGNYSDVIIISTEYDDESGEYKYDYWFSQSLGMTIYSRDEFTDTLGDIYVTEIELKNID